MSQKQQIDIHYWKLRGLVEHIKTLCEYLEVPYKLHLKESEEEWKAECEKLRQSGFKYPNLPYIKDGDFLLSEQMAIIMYLARKYDSKLIFDNNDEIEFAQNVGVVYDFKNYINMFCYKCKSKEELKQSINNFDQLKSRVKTLASVLKDQDYILKRGLSIIDFFFAEMVELALTMEKEVGCDVFGEHRDLFQKYLDRFLSLDKIKKYRESDRFMERPYNNMKKAVWG